jgi:putative phosphoribosyl transferase
MQPQTDTHAQKPDPDIAMHVSIPVGHVVLSGDLIAPSTHGGIVLFAHGGGSSRLGPRGRALAEALVHEGFATLLVDLLTPEEEASEPVEGGPGLAIPLLVERLVGAIEWAERYDRTAALPVGVFGAGAGAAVALIAAARMRNVSAIVSRGGRPDLADEDLPEVPCPTLLIVGGDDPEGIALNRRAIERLTAEAVLHIVPGASHRFDEPGALQRVAEVTAAWFHKHLIGARARTEPYELWDPC